MLAILIKNQDELDVWYKTTLLMTDNDQRERPRKPDYFPIVVVWRFDSDDSGTWVDYVYVYQTDFISPAEDPTLGQPQVDASTPAH